MKVLVYQKKMIFYNLKLLFECSFYSNNFWGFPIKRIKINANLLQREKITKYKKLFKHVEERNKLWNKDSYYQIEITSKFCKIEDMKRYPLSVTGKGFCRECESQVTFIGMPDKRRVISFAKMLFNNYQI